VTAGIIALAFAIGFADGLRCLTPPAVVSWAARLGFIDLEGTWLAFLGYAATPYIFTVLALAELVGDKLPTTPSRKAPLGLTARLVLGALTGAALVAAAHQSWILGAVPGALGGLAGAVIGYEIRTRSVRRLGCPDWMVALAEDAVAVGGAILIVAAAS
jgi:uncharacterized membrane protein